MSDYSPLTLTRFPRRRGRGLGRWIVWGIAVAMIPVAVKAAYQPGFLLPANNLSDVASASTARTNLGVPASSTTISTTAPLAGGGDLSANRTLTLSDCTATTKGGVPTPPNNTTTFLRGDCTFAAPGAAAPTAPTIYAGTLPVTLGSTNDEVVVIEMASPGSGTINLPASPTAGTVKCVKDGLKNFAANVATIKTTDNATIDKVAGSTGYAMNQNGQLNCFKYASSGTNWYVY